MAGKAAGDTIIAPGDPTIQVFTASGTWTKPNGVRAVRVRISGGGGGGGGGTGGASGRSAGGGGGAGGYAEQYILAAGLSATEAVTVGAGGTATAAGTGGTGGTTSFGTHCSATGGTGGAAMANVTTNGSSSQGSGGTGSGGDVVLQGDDGYPGLVAIGTSNLQVAGAGGGNPLAGSQRGPIPSGSAGVTGHTYGGGGSGAMASTGNLAGGTGAAGVVIVEMIY